MHADSGAIAAVTYLQGRELSCSGWGSHCGSFKLYGSRQIGLAKEVVPVTALIGMCQGHCSHLRRHKQINTRFDTCSYILLNIIPVDVVP